LKVVRVSLSTKKTEASGVWRGAHDARVHLHSRPTFPYPSTAPFSVFSRPTLEPSSPPALHEENRGRQPFFAITSPPLLPALGPAHAPLSPPPPATRAVMASRFLLRRWHITGWWLQPPCSRPLRPSCDVGNMASSHLTLGVSAPVPSTPR
jgi:hypothetical protein